MPCGGVRKSKTIIGIPGREKGHNGGCLIVPLETLHAVLAEEVGGAYVAIPSEVRSGSSREGGVIVKLAWDRIYADHGVVLVLTYLYYIVL